MTPAGDRVECFSGDEWNHVSYSETAGIMSDAVSEIASDIGPGPVVRRGVQRIQGCRGPGARAVEAIVPVQV